MTDAPLPPLPPPPVPADADLRGLPFMPLYGQQLLASDFNARASDTGWRAAVTLWWQAWLQVPAGSLPDDDVILCRLAELGRDLRTWKRIKGEALHGFVKHADGRLYSPFLAKLACEAWDRRVQERARKAKWRAERGGGDASGDADTPPLSPSPDAAAETGTRRGQTRMSPSPSASPDASGDGQRALKGQGQGQGSKKEGSVPSERAGEPPPPAPPVVVDRLVETMPSKPPQPTEIELIPPASGDASIPLFLVRPRDGDWRTALFRQGLDWLATATGKPAPKLRGLVGLWLKALQDDARACFDVLAEAQKLDVAEPVAWIAQAVATRAGSSGAQRAVEDDAALRRRAEAAANAAV
ncbi:MAG: YdaU family protein [Tagaea sp.]|nr:YdaU family protein [Tagaea sp.]